MEEVDNLNFKKNVEAQLLALNNRVAALESQNASIGTVSDADDAPEPLGTSVTFTGSSGVIPTAPVADPADTSVE